MAHRRLVLRERITAILGAALLFVLVAASYYYSIQVELAGLRYVPSEMSPDFRAKNVTLTDFDKDGKASIRLAASTMDHYSDERMRATDARYYTLETHKPQLTIASDKAWSNDSLATVELSGNVTLNRAAAADELDLHFRTDYLKGFLDTQEFETTSPVFMRRGIDTTQASDGLHYNDVQHSVELIGSVVSVFHPTTPKSE